MQHLAAVSVIHVFQGREKRAEVQTVDDKYTPYRVFYSDNGRPLIPRYHQSLEGATDDAKRFAFQ